ncbi:unnamed protein product, partial [Didymodactylos carnosus]
DVKTKKSYLIAIQDNPIFKYNQHISSLEYTDGGDIRVQVLLTCREEGGDTFSGQQPDHTHYIISIQSRCACPGLCQYTVKKGLTAGAVLVIILICLVTTYLVGGMLFMKFKRGASGFEMLPNRTFWIKTTLNAVGGVRYSFNAIQGKRTETRYEPVK